MEITTTMVRFRFPKAMMVKRTEKAQLFICEKDGAKAKVWVPLSKLEVKEADEKDNEVVMAKWLYMKGELPLYTDAKEFMVTSEVTQEQLDNDNN